MARAAKLAFAVSLLALNFYFVWSSYLLRWLSPSLYVSVNRAIRSQDIALFQGLHLDTLFYSSEVYYTQIVADFEALLLLFVLIASTAYLSRRGGPGRSLLRTLQISSICFVAFGVELAIFDNSEFYIHFTDAQLAYNIIPWFSNADMFLSALAIFGSTTLLINPSWRRNSLAIVAVALVVMTAVVAIAISESSPVAPPPTIITQNSTQVSSVDDSFHGGNSPGARGSVATFLGAPLLARPFMIAVYG